MSEVKMVGGSLMVVIPPDVARKVGIKKGSRVDVSCARGKAVIAPAAKPDWASFFAMDFGIPKDFMIERTPLEDRDVFK